MLSVIHPDVNPYHYVLNNPIIFNDPLGLHETLAGKDDEVKPGYIEEVTVTASRPSSLTYIFGLFNQKTPRKKSVIKWGRSMTPEEQERHDNFMAGIDAMVIGMHVALCAPAAEMIGVIIGEGSISLNSTATILKNTLKAPLNPINQGATLADIANQAVDQLMTQGNVDFGKMNLVSIGTNLFGAFSIVQGTASGFFKYSVGDGWDNSLNGKGLVQAITNSAFNVAGGKGANAISSVAPYFGRIVFSGRLYMGANFMSTQIANEVNSYFDSK